MWKYEIPLKTLLLNYLKQHKIVTIAQISKSILADPLEILEILRDLEREGKVKITHNYTIFYLSNQ